MVRKMTDRGGEYHEPPYTGAEELELYLRMSPGPEGLTILRRPDAPQRQPKKSQKRQ